VGGKKKIPFLKKSMAQGRLNFGQGFWRYRLGGILRKRKN
jgi:hypothetical protein